MQREGGMEEGREREKESERGRRRQRRRRREEEAERVGVIGGRGGKERN